MAPFRTLSASLLVLLFTLCDLTSAAAESYCTIPEPGLPFCAITGNNDFYGIGVRIGIYLAWLTSWIANNFLASEISGSLDTNAVFLLAIFVTIMFNSIWHQLRMIDALVLLHLCYGFLFGVMSLWGYRTMYYHRMGPKGRGKFGGFGTHMRLFLMTAISGYAVWFWFEGLDDGLIECDKREACGGLQSFFFVKVRLDGWYRTFYKVGAIICVLYYGIMCVAAILAWSLRVLRLAKNGWKGWKEGFEEEDYEDTGLDERELSYTYIGLATFNLFWMIWAAVTVEFTLVLNHLTDVLGENGLSDPGQQIPLLIGIFSFVRIMWLIFREYYMERADNAETRGLGVKRTGASAQRMPISATPNTFPQQHGHINSIPLIARHGDRALAQRMLVAYLPWLTDFEAFRNKGRRDGEGFEAVRTAEPTPATEMQPKSMGFNVDVESLGSRKAGPSDTEKI